MHESAYASSFFDYLRAPAADSADVVVPLVTELVAPRRVIDVGCGTGTWLRRFREQGAQEILGVDGDYVDRSSLDIAPEHFVAWDLTQRLDTTRTFDLVVSLEVGEHLPPERAESFVEDLAQLAPVVLFSAAIPHQGGKHHVNEQWPDYWAAFFAQHGLRPVDCLRPLLWSDPRVAWWYAQNTLLYVSDDVLASQPELAAAQRWQSGPPLRLVHPFRYGEWVAYATRLSVERWNERR